MCVDVLLTAMADWESIVCMSVDHDLSVRSPVDGHLSCFRFLAIINTAAIEQASEIPCLDTRSMV